MRISDWSSDVCSSDLCLRGLAVFLHVLPPGLPVRRTQVVAPDRVHFAAIVAQRRPVQAIEQAVGFAAGGNRIRRLHFWCVDFRCTNPALSVLAGYRPDRDTAPLQLRLTGWIERFLPCPRPDIVSDSEIGR